MYNLNQIQCLIINEEIWKIYFFSIGVLGIYFSAIIIGYVKQRDKRNLFLGLYLLSISTLLIHLSSIIYPIDLINEVLESIGVASLFLIGPFSYLMYQRSNDGQVTYLFTIQLIPAVLAAVLIQLLPPSVFWIYLLGIVHIGCYLVGQSILVFKMDSAYQSDQYNHQITQDKWYKRYNLTQVLLFVAISFTCLNCTTVFCYVFASISLVILILLIWIRLLQSAHIKYLK